MADDLKILPAGMMTEIGERGINRLFVEAGARLAESFIAGELVDRLQIIDTPLAGNGDGMLVKQMIKANQGQVLIQVIDLAYLFGLLMDPAESAAASRSVALAA